MYCIYLPKYCELMHLVAHNSTYFTGINICSGTDDRMYGNTDDRMYGKLLLRVSGESEFAFELLRELVVDVLVVPVLTPLFRIYLRWRVLLVRALLELLEVVLVLL